MSITLIIVVSLLFVGIVAGLLIKQQLEDHAKARAKLTHDQLARHVHTFSKVCEELLNLNPISAERRHYQGALTQLTTVELQYLPDATLTVKLSAQSQARSGQLTLTLQSMELSLRRGAHAALSLPIPSTLSSTYPFELFLSGRVITQSIHAVRDERLTTLSGVFTSEDQAHVIHLKPWLDKLAQSFEQGIKRCEEHERSWTTAALEQRTSHPIWTPILLYLAASEQEDASAPQWQTLLERDAEHWSRLPSMPQLTPGFSDEPGELLQRLYPHPTEEMVKVLERRGELERMRAQGTLSSALGLAWLMMLDSDDPRRELLIPYLDAEHNMRYLMSGYPLKWPDSIAQLTTRLNDPQDPLCVKKEITLEAIGLWSEESADKSLLKLLSDQLRRSPELAPKLRFTTLTRLLTKHPDTLRGSLLKQLLDSLNDRAFVELQNTLMTRTEPWTVFEYAMDHPTWRDYVSSNLNYKQGWSMVAAMLRDKKALTIERLRSISKHIEAPIHHEEQARILREYFLVAQELDLHKQLWGTLLKTMQRSKAHQEALQFVHDRWEPLIIDRSRIGGLSLSEDHSNAGALSVINAEQGSLIVQDDERS